MTDEQVTVVIGMPTDEGKREELARVREQAGHGYMKPIIYTGSQKRHCADCGQELWVGPRSITVLYNPAAVLICPWCIPGRTDDADTVSLKHLGNPEDQRR